jgi:hypothetical protein
MKTILKWSLLIICFGSMIASCNKNNKDIEDKILPEELDCNSLSSDRTLRNDPNKPIDYILKCGVVPVLGRITIEPGTVISVEDDGGFAVVGNGALNAIGTSANPIVFTGVTKQNGSWRGIYFETSSINNVLENCRVEYAGGQAFNSNNDKGAIVIWASARARIENSEISHSEHAGLNMVYNNANVTLANNSFSNTKGVPIHTVMNNVHFIQSSNSFINNQDSYILCESGTLVGGQTLRKLSIPYRFRKSPFNHGATVEDGTFTIDKGVNIEVENSAYILINSNGALRMNGTADEPIVVQGVEKIPGSWTGFYFTFTSSINNVMEHVTIQHAGDGTEQGKGAITMWANPRLRVQNCTFRDIGACGFYNYSGNVNPNLTQSNNTFSNVSNGDICGE